MRFCKAFEQLENSTLLSLAVRYASLTAPYFCLPSPLKSIDQPLFPRADFGLDADIFAFVWIYV